MAQLAEKGELVPEKSERYDGAIDLVTTRDALRQERRIANGVQQTLRAGDSMLKRIDLAYAINTHMVQGMTNETNFAVMGATERNLSNARSFLVKRNRGAEPSNG